MRTVHDILRMAQPTTVKQERQLRDLSQLIHDYPEALPHIAGLMWERLETNNRAASVREAFERLRWDNHIHMGNDICPLLSRALIYVYLDLNGVVRLVPVPIDEALGMRVSDRKLPGDYARRLQWVDGRPLTEAPTQVMKKTVQSVRPMQGELFEVAG